MRRVLEVVEDLLHWGVDVDAVRVLGRGHDAPLPSYDGDPAGSHGTRSSGVGLAHPHFERGRGPMAWQGTKGPGAAQSLAGDSTRSTPPTNRYPPTPEGRDVDSTSR